MTARALGVLAVAAAFLCSPRALSAEEKSPHDYVTVKSQEGLTFNVPEDWPVEKRGSTVGPVPVEEYLAMKFAKVNERIDALEKRVSQLESEEEKRKHAARQKMLGSEPAVEKSSEEEKS
ncbi:MAG TPA: hypothetical protein VL688_06315 [Verrucomicrobiae bacterium]|jgi:hypothetical protein|nr:hypothetical protein [Verrucomicrobiae bacterium]